MTRRRWWHRWAWPYQDGWCRGKVLLSFAGYGYLVQR